MFMIDLSKFTKEITEHFKTNKSEITEDLLETLRSQGNEGKHLALEILDIPRDEENYYLDAYGNRISQNGNRMLKKPFTKIAMSDIHKIELQKCAQDIHYYTENYVKIVTPKGINFPDLRIYQSNFLDLITPPDNEDIVGLLPRQCCSSTTTVKVINDNIEREQTFEELFNECINEHIIYNGGKFIESYPGGGRQILTPNGYKEILEVHKTIKYPKFEIQLSNGMSLKGAHNHVVIDSENREVYLDDCLGSLLQTEIGISEVVSVLDLGVEEHMFDMSIDSEDELYYSDGILSHNSGKSVTVGIYLSHEYAFSKDMNIGVAANKAGMAREFLDKTKNILINLPIWMQPGTKVWNKSFIEAENGMRILTDATSSDSFRGFSVHIVVVDEVAFIRPNLWEEFADAIFPSQSALAFKKTILISTSNGMNAFYHIIKGARNGTNGFLNYEVDWKEVPRYRSDGTIKPPEEFRDEIIAKYGPIYFNQNYGGDFMGSSYTLISSDKLKSMESKEPVLIIDGKLKIYHEPIKGHQYIMSVDASKDGSDAFVVQVIDITDFKFRQAAVAKLQIDYLRMPEYINEWCEYYHRPYLIIENNEGAGQSVADQMYQTYEYENLHWDKKAESSSTNLSKSRKSYPGFRTTTKTRKQILQTMKTMIEHDNLEINDSDTIKEFLTFILIREKYQADEGTHDDCIISLAIAFAIFCNVKNFHDMKDVVKLIFTDEENEDVTMSDIISIGSFDDGVDEAISIASGGSSGSGYSTMEEYINEQDGFY
jgi:hypothetical protein